MCPRSCVQQLGQPVNFGDRDCQLRMAEHSERIETAYWRAERDEHSAVTIGSERQPPVGDGKSSRPRGLQEGIRPGHRYIGDVRQRCGDAPPTEMGIEFPVAHIHEGVRRADAERASRQTIRPREPKGKTLDATHRSDATEGSQTLAVPRMRASTPA